jgi:hypothetical protein
MNTAHTQGINTFISQLAGTSVTLREVKPGAWVAVPKDRAHMASKTWQALKAGPEQGIGQTPAEAAILLALAMGKAGMRKPSKQQAAKAWLQSLLGSGLALMATDIKARAQDAGHAWTAVDRAARELGIQRQKLGMSGPWMWCQPLKAE